MVRSIVMWNMLGLPLAFKKAQFAQCVNWIGFAMRKLQDRVEVTVPDEKM